MLKRWKKLTSKILYQNPWWKYKVDQFEIAGGVSGEYHYVYTNGSSMVVPITREGKIILVRQFRYLCQKESLEFPCGSVKDEHNYLQTAKLELAEETGYEAETVEEIAEFNPYNGVTCEICRVFIACNLKPGSGKPDETEEFIIEEYTVQEIDSMVYNNTIWDGMTLSCWVLTRHLALEKLAK